MITIIIMIYEQKNALNLKVNLIKTFYKTFYTLATPGYT